MAKKSFTVDIMSIFVQLTFGNLRDNGLYQAFEVLVSDIEDGSG